MAEEFSGAFFDDAAVDERVEKYFVDAASLPFLLFHALRWLCNAWRFLFRRGLDGFRPLLAWGETQKLGSCFGARRVKHHPIRLPFRVRGWIDRNRFQIARIEMRLMDFIHLHPEVLVVGIALLCGKRA